MTQKYLTSEQFKNDGHIFVDTQAETLRANLRKKKSSQEILVGYV